MIVICNIVGWVCGTFLFGCVVWSFMEGMRKCVTKYGDTWEGLGNYILDTNPIVRIVFKRKLFLRDL